MRPRVGAAPGACVLLLSIALLYLTAPAVAVEEEGDAVTLPLSDDAIIAFPEERPPPTIHPIAMPASSEYAAYGL